MYKCQSLKITRLIKCNKSISRQFDITDKSNLNFELLNTIKTK